MSYPQKRQYTPRRKKQETTDAEEQEAKMHVDQTVAAATSPLSSRDIEQATGLRVMPSRDFLRNSLDQNLNGQDAVVLLLESKDNPMYGHWVLVMRSPQQPLLAEYFDSFGRPVPENLQNYFQHQLPNGSMLAFAKSGLQKKIKETQTCGRWVILRYRAKNLSLEQFIKKTLQVPLNLRDLVVSDNT